jgi:micrococcal nuclease
VLLAVAAILGAIGQNDDSSEESDDTVVTAAVTDVSSTPRAHATPLVTHITRHDLQRDPAQLQFARVVDVIDGDTIDVAVDGVEERVRYYGVDTPERGDSCFREATERNEELVGSAVLLLEDVRDRDGNGRLLRYVFDSEGNSVDATLIAEGLAYAWREDGMYRERLVELEERAGAAAVGCLWR